MVIDCCVILLTFLFPPVGVFLVCGCGAELLINICLTLLGFLPGHIHAFYILVTYASKPQQPYQQVPSGRTHRHQGANYQTYQPQPQPQQPTIVVPPVGDKKDYRGPSEVGSSNVNTQPYPQQKSNTDAPPPYKN